MGSWFSNLHVRKKEGISQNSVMEYIREWMSAQHYELSATESEADAAFAIVSDASSQWYCVYSDLFSFENPKQFADIANPLSGAFGSDVLGISCFDSDYLYLNLINADGDVNAWAGVGSAMGLGIRRRSSLSAWKTKVEDFPTFKAAVKKEYVFAEEVLAELEPCLCLPQELSSACLETLEKDAAYLYFKLPEVLKTQELPKFVQSTYSQMPCFVDKPSIVTVCNIGGASKGLSVFFLGPYVEQETLTFSEVSFVMHGRGNRAETKTTPITLEKRQLRDGQWAYYYHEPTFRIPPKVDERLPRNKQMQQSSEREIVLRFVPQGDARKVLDVTVVVMPDQNPEGLTTWNVWQTYGSKERYIEEYNSGWRMFPNCEKMLIRAEDFD